MSDEGAQERGRTVPIHDWWAAAVKRELPGSSFKNQKGLAASLGVSEPRVSRCLKSSDDKDWKPTLDLLIGISDKLGLPYPVLLPETEDLAVEVVKTYRSRKRMAELEEIAAGVTGNKQESQTPVPVSEHAVRKRKPRKRKRARVSAG